MPFDFGNSLNWDILSRQERRASYPSYTATEHNPIPFFSIPCHHRIVMVGCRSTGAKSHWKLGCWARQRLLISPSSTSTFVSLSQCKERYFCQLDLLTKIEFPEYNSYPYLLILEIPKWLDHISIEAWVYSGPETSSEIESINAALARIESRLP